MAYKTIYYFEVYGKIKEGKNVYCLDRGDQVIEFMNNLEVNDFISLLNNAEKCKDENRYEFWVEEAKEA